MGSNSISWGRMGSLFNVLCKSFVFNGKRVVTVIATWRDQVFPFYGRWKNVTILWTYSAVRSMALLRSGSNISRRSWPFSVTTIQRPFLTFLWSVKLRNGHERWTLRKIQEKFHTFTFSFRNERNTVLEIENTLRNEIT